MEKTLSVFVKNIGSRYLLLAAAVGLLFISVGIFIFIQPKYVPLYTGLAAEDAAPIVNSLKEQKKHYQVKSGGSEIWVQEQDVDSIRIAIAGKGGLGGGLVGYEVFDKGDYGATDFSQKINFQRAMQGELARAIMKMKSVAYARVFLSMPEEKLFSNISEQAKASVVLSLKQGASLSAIQVAGIQMLVAGSIPNLKRENVSIHDESGEVISRDAVAESGSLSGNLKTKMEMEEYLTNKALAVLYKAVGPGNGYVAVNVDMNFDDVNKQSEIVFPHDAKVGAITVYEKSSDSKRNEKRRGSAASQEESEPEILDQQSEVKYEISKATESKVFEKGKIEQISASAVITAKGISPQQIDAIKKLIGSAIGVNESRGDKIDISSFDVALDDESAVIPGGGGNRHAGNEEPLGLNGEFGEAFSDQAHYLIAVAFLVVVTAFLAILVYRRINRSRVLDALQKTLDSI